MAGPSRGGTWVQAHASVDANITYNDVFFFDETHGWIVGSDNGQAFVLFNDSGEPSNWVSQTIPAGVTNLRRVFFVATDEGWAVGEGEKVLHYTSGSGWQEQYSGSNSLSSVFFLDSSKGWIGEDSSGTVRSTTNGGVAWGSQDIIGGRVNDVAFASSTLGWAATSMGLTSNIMVTDMGGMLWWDASVLPISSWIFGLEVVDPNTVLAVGVGGEIWLGTGPFIPEGTWGIHYTHAPTEDLHDIDLAEADPGFGWAVGDNSTVVHTVDGGTTWLGDAVVPAGLALSSVSALNRGVAWAVGNGTSGGVLIQFGCTDSLSDCTDQDACTEMETCSVGVCTFTATDCDDGEICTDDSCDSVTGCINTDNTANCDDLDECTTGDVCAGGMCTGTPLADLTLCGGGAGVCCAGVCETGSCCQDADCISDGNPCTTDSCLLNTCQYVNNSLACDDGEECTSPDQCSGGVCQGTARADLTSCAADSGLCCSGVCQLGDCCQASDCPSDGQVCTDDVCLANSCTYQNNSDACDDGNECTAPDQCSGGTCQSANQSDMTPCASGSGRCCAGSCQMGDCCIAADCDDGEVCTDDDCSANSCSNTPNSAACDDGDVCNGPNSCSAGTCQVVGPPLDCDDGNVCTDDSCDPVNGCQYADNTVPCDDGDACTSGDSCLGGSCQPGGALDCDDGNGCTDDWCDGVLGCQYSDNTEPCSDGDVCTLGDTCSGGLCQAGMSSLDCDDGNLCTTDSCDPVAGCDNAPNTDSCDDNDACTEPDMCSGGACQSGLAVNCDDSNVCTDDSCLPALGCQNVENTASCDDIDPCTMNDQCLSGVCLGEAKDSDSDGYVDQNCGGDDCADDQPSINPGQFEAAFGDPVCADSVDNDCDDLTDESDPGCVQCTQDSDCDDGSVCNGLEICAAPACQSGVPLDCDDGNGCTDDSCDAVVGCQYDNNSAPCSDGDACTSGDSCQAGSCQAGATVDCDDGNLCTSDSCDQGDGCHNTPADGLACDDLDACTLGDVCSAGVCQAGPGTPDCSDPNPCTVDSCDPVLGCRNLALPDGSECAARSCIGLEWQSQTCHAALCDRPLLVEDCADGVDCTIDSCAALSGCGHQTDDLACDTGDACTTGRCDPVLDCVSEPIADGQMCAICQVCDSGACVPQPEQTDCQSSFQCAGRCDENQVCVVEGLCSQVTLSDCPDLAPLVDWRTGQDCRMPVDSVALTVEVLSPASGAGELVPVRMALVNRLDFPLERLYLKLSLRPGGENSPRAALVKDSSRLDALGPTLDIVALDQGDELVFAIQAQDTGLQPLVQDGSAWVLNLLFEGLAGPVGVFEASVWAPCQSLPEQVGCHVGFGDLGPQGELVLPLGLGGAAQGLQSISKPVLMDLAGRRLDSSEDIEKLRSISLGCQCGGGGNHLGLLILLILIPWGFRRNGRL